MRAVYYETHGDAEVLQIGELDNPAFGDEQVLVEVNVTMDVVDGIPAGRWRITPTWADAGLQDDRDRAP